METKRETLSITNVTTKACCSPVQGSGWVSFTDLWGAVCAAVGLQNSKDRVLHRGHLTPHRSHNVSSLTWVSPQVVRGLVPLVGVSDWSRSLFSNVFSGLLATTALKPYDPFTCPNKSKMVCPFDSKEQRAQYTCVQELNYSLHKLHSVTLKLPLLHWFDKKQNMGLEITDKQTCFPLDSQFPNWWRLFHRARSNAFYVTLSCLKNKVSLLVLMVVLGVLPIWRFLFVH